MTKTRPFLSMCYGDPSATEVPPCCETATKKLTFSSTSVLLLLNMPLSLSRATIFRRQKNPRRVYRPKIAGILFVCNEPEGKYYTVPSKDKEDANIRQCSPTQREWCIIYDADMLIPCHCDVCQSSWNALNTILPHPVQP